METIEKIVYQTSVLEESKSRVLPHRWKNVRVR